MEIEIILNTKYNKIAEESNKLFEYLNQNLNKIQLKKLKKYIYFDRKLNKGEY